MIKKLQKRNSRVSLATVVLLSAFLAVACSKDPVKAPATSKPPVPPAKVAVEQPKPVQAKVSSSSRIPALPASQFDFSNKKDPFKPFITVKTESKNAAEPNKKTLHNLLPIHSYDVNQFKLIGVITGGRENKAMVTDPGGKGYVLKVGMSIGKNDGKISLINSSGVEVVELFKDDNGRVRKENFKLTLPRKQ